MKIKSVKFIFSISFFIMILSPNFSFADKVGMMTGSSTGTYIKFGKAIAEASKHEGVDILVRESDGSVDNIKKMLDRDENASFAIVQSDVLGYLSRSSDRELKRSINRLRMIYPFYNEEVHVFARKNINKLSDLDGKRVVVGKKGSGTNMTAWNIFRLAGINPSERIHKGREEGIHMVLTNEADAVFTVVAKPVDAFKRLFSSTKPSIKKLLKETHMLPLDGKDLLAEYVPAVFDSDDYDGIGKVKTIAVKAMLVSFDFSNGSSSYYKRRCKQLKGVGKAIKKNINNWKNSINTKEEDKWKDKWKEVNLDESVGTWKLDKCSRGITRRSESHDQQPENEEIKCVLLGTC